MSAASIMLEALRAAAPEMADRADALDRDGGFPVEDVEVVRRSGLLSGMAPRGCGGQGWGTEPEGAETLARALLTIGRGSLAVGRVVEGHINAIKLIATYGTARQVARAAKDARGHLFAIWNTETAPLRLDDGVLAGGKIVCSAAGFATRPVVTARRGEDTVMAVLDLGPGERVGEAGDGLQGMRAAGTRAMELTGVAVDADAIFGGPGDYLRQPEFSAGAWRTAAVTAGGIAALAEAVAAQLRARGRDGDPHQRARLGGLFIAAETARLWAIRAGMIAEGGGAAGDVAGYVNLARLAVERAGLDAIELAQRSLGLAAFMREQRVERLLRDLATYLRQPAPDETLTEAAAWFATRDLPT